MVQIENEVSIEEALHQEKPGEAPVIPQNPLVFVNVDKFCEDSFFGTFEKSRKRRFRLDSSFQCQKRVEKKTEYYNNFSRYQVIIRVLISY